MHVSRLSFAFSLCGLLWLRPSRPSQHTACNNSGCPAALARPQTRQKASLGSSTRIASLRPIQPAFDGLQALASAQLIIILLISDFPQYLRHHCRRFYLSTGNNILASSSAVWLSQRFRLASSREASYGLLLICALRASRSPQSCSLEPRRVRPGLLPCVVFRSYLLA